MKQIGTAITPDRKETILSNFCQQSRCVDGNDPTGALHDDNLGNFYGVAQCCGFNRDRIVF